MADIAKAKRNIKRMIDAGAPEADIDAYLEIEGISLDDLNVSQNAMPTEEPSTMQKVKDYGKELVSNIPGNALDIVKGVGTMIANPVDVAVGLSEITGGAAQSFAKEIPGIGGLIPDTPEQEKFDELRRGASESLMDTIDDPSRVLDYVKEKPVDAALTAAPGIGATIGKGKNLLKAAPAAVEKKIAGEVTRGVEKGIRPTVVGRRTAPQNQRYFRNAQEAVETIVNNKDKLQLTDELGNTVTGLPQNLKQFSQAIDQMKRSVFEEYNNMAVQAGEVGAEIDLMPAARELLNIADDPKIKKFAPEVGKYAEKRAGELLSGGSKLGVVDAQDSLAIINKQIEPFYKNPTYDEASKAYIESLIANRIRKGLDNVIESASSSGYADLKRAYGSLKSIERDVTHRANIDARKSERGLIDFSDIFTHTTAIHGILSMNPSLVGAAAVGKTTKALYKMKTDPNRIVRNMFTRTEKLMEKRATASAGSR